MKKVLHIQFYSDAAETLLKELAVMVAKNNSGKANLGLVTLQGYFNAYCARYDYQCEASIHEDSLSLKIDGNPFINITEHILIESEQHNISV